MKKGTLYGIFVLFVIVFLIIIVSRHKTTTFSAPLVAEDNAVLLVDQTPASDGGLVVSYAKLSKPGFVVVSEKDATTNTTSVIGTSALLSAGEHFNVPITSTKKSTHGSGSHSVSATLVADDGDGLFSEETDSEVLPTDSSDETSDTAMDEATLSDDAGSVEDLTVGDVADALNEGGYTVDEEVVNSYEGGDTVLSAVDDDSDDSMMTDDSSGTPDEGSMMEETPDDSSTGDSSLDSMGEETPDNGSTTEGSGEQTQ